MTVCGDRRTTYGEMAVRTRRLANFLADRGFGAHRDRDGLDNWECGQDRIALIMFNDRYPEMVIGCLKARTVPVNVNHHYTPREVADLLDYVKPRAVIYHLAHGAKFADVLESLGADLLIAVDDGSGAPDIPGSVRLDDAVAQGDPDARITGSPDDLIMYCTGGTTGRPKGVLWRQSDTYVSSMVGADHESAAEIHDKVARTEGAPWFAVSPLMHAAGLWTVFSGTLAGLPVVLYDDRNKFDPALVLRTAEREKVGMMTMVGDAYAAPLVEELNRDSYDLSTLYAIGTGGAATNPKHVSALLEKLPAADDHQRLRLVGDREHGVRPQPAGVAPGDLRSARRRHRGVRRHDPVRRGRANPRSAGWCATGRIPLGYFDDADATRRTFPVVEGQRVVVSGDRASLEADGTLRLYGRDSLVVNTGGEKVFVEEVEAVLRACPGVVDALGRRPRQRAMGAGDRRARAASTGRDRRRRVTARRVRRAPGPLQGAEGVHLRRHGPPARQRQGRLPVGEKPSDATGTDMTNKADRVIDCLVNVHFGETEQQPNWMLKVRDDYFKGPESMFAPVELAELLDEMDEHGVAKAILMDNLAKPSVTARKFVESRPDRFALAMGGVNLLRPMPSLRELTAVVKRSARGVYRCGTELLGRRAVSAQRRRLLSAVHEVRRDSSCRCASTPACRARRSPVRCRTRSTSTGCACASPS